MEHTNNRYTGKHIIILMGTIVIVLSLILIVQYFFAQKNLMISDKPIIYAGIFALILCVIWAVLQYAEICRNEKSRLQEKQNPDHPLHKKLHLLEQAHSKKYISHKSFHSGKSRLQEEINRQNK